MKLVLTPHYKDLFPGENDRLDDPLAGVPSVLILELMAMIDAELFSRDEGQDTQLKIFNLMLGRQAPQRRLLILKNAFEDPRGNQDQRQFFTRHYNLSFMHYVLTHVFEEKQVDDLTPQQELNVFKAYFLVAQETGQAPLTDKSKLPAFDEDYFSKMMWPSMLDGFEINMRTDPYATLLRGVVFLNYLQFHTPYKAHVESFLRMHGKVTTLNYAFDVFNILNVNFRSLKESNNQFASFTIARSPGFESIMAQFSLDPNEYRQQYVGKKENSAGIKSRPLYQLDENTWLVLNWSFLSSKLYEGLVFEFYHTSGISREPAFYKFVRFKQFIGEHITEKHLFQLLAKATWKKKHEVLLFDDGKTSGFPDAYYRIGNKIFLFEIKDVYFPSEAINSFSYEKIKAAIDNKLNSTEKGTGQIIKQLRKLKAAPFEQPQRYKKNAHLEIYPVVVYADIHFSLPGISEYVGRSFEKMLARDRPEKRVPKGLAGDADPYQLPGRDVRCVAA
jgi:hypothetical protein